MAKIYISSTFEDLKACRDAVLRTLRGMRQEVDAMEDQAATELRPLDKCLADVSQCDLYVGILAWRYGFIPPEGQTDQKSITELEYRRAVSLDKPLRLFLLDKDAEWNVGLMDEGATSPTSPIRRLRDELSMKHVVKFFRNQDDLARLVAQQVDVWMEERRTTEPPTVSATSQPGQVDARVLTAGLVALAELMRSPEVRGAVIQCEADLKAARKQITLLGDLKELHEALHNLQIRCLNPIVQEAVHFPDDAATVDRLSDICDMDVQGIIDDVNDVALRQTVVNPETPWVRDLGGAAATLREAIKGKDSALLRKAIWSFGRVLSLQPTTINKRLNDAARDLRLPALIAALGHVRDGLAGTAVDPERVRQFQLGIDALTRLDVTLSILIQEHDGWQSVDAELRLLQASLRGETNDLDLEFPHLMEMAEPLYANQSDDRAVALRLAAAQMEAAIAAQDPVAVERAFQRYRTLANDRFFRVDASLRRLSGELRTVTEPLEGVLVALGFAA